MGQQILEAFDSEVGRICLRAVVIAILVGTVLNLINQADAILSGKPVIIWKIILTYLVPFIVSTHGALSARNCAARR